MIKNLSQCCRLLIARTPSLRYLMVHILLLQSSTRNWKSWSIHQGCRKAPLLNSLTSLSRNIKTPSEFVLSLAVKLYSRTIYIFDFRTLWTVTSGIRSFWWWLTIWLYGLIINRVIIIVDLDAILEECELIGEPVPLSIYAPSLPNMADLSISWFCKICGVLVSSYYSSLFLFCKC